jgi:hypothetical protein
MNDELSKTKVEKALKECEIHLKRMAYARGKLAELMPMDEQGYLALTEAQIESLDQYIFRYIKMQDAMGERLFRQMLDLLEEPARSQPFLDKLNRLEQLGAISSKEAWLKLRNLRNLLTHEYEDDSASMSEVITQVYGVYPEVEATYQQAADFIRPYLH